MSNMKNIDLIPNSVWWTLRFHCSVGIDKMSLKDDEEAACPSQGEKEGKVVRVGAREQRQV